MKIRLFLSVSLLVLISLPAICQTPFDGKWTVNKEKTVVPGDQLSLAKITMQVKGDSLLTTRTYSSPDGQEYPFDEKLTLDGREHKITIYEMPRVTKAKKDATGAIVIESKTTFNGNGGEADLIAKETFSSDGSTLTMTFINQMGDQSFNGTFYYIR